MSDLQSQSSSVLTRFAEAGLVLKKECRKELCEYILTISGSAPKNYVWKGFNLDKSGRIVHIDEDQILCEATETADIIRASGILEYPRNDEKYYKWMITATLPENNSCTSALAVTTEMSFCKYKHSRPAVQRSKNVAGFIATQFMSSENGTKVSSIIGQCSTRIIFRTSALDSLRRILPKSDKRNEIIKEIDSLGVGTALVCSENKDTIFSGEDYIGNTVANPRHDPPQPRRNQPLSVSPLLKPLSQLLQCLFLYP